MSDKNPFTEVYFMDGVKAGVSNFENYSFRPDATVAMVLNLKRYLGITNEDFVYEIGCARGFYVKAMRMIGVRAFGQDISEWAIGNCHPDVQQYVSVHLNLQPRSYDVIWGKDFAEHVPPEELKSLVQKMCEGTRRKVFLIVPLARHTDGDYVHPKEENDKTHVNRWTLHDWLHFLQNCSDCFVVNGSYRYPGLKPGTYEAPFGYGFLTMDRV